MNHARSFIGVLSLLAFCVLATGCTTTPPSPEAKENLMTLADDGTKQMYTSDPSLKNFVDRAYGYAIFPRLGKGAFIVGGSYGRGMVYEQGQFVGYADLSQATIGLQAGGESFRELIVFESRESLDRFKQGQLKFAANVSAVILKTGAGQTARYTDGVAVFVEPIAGAMVEAAIGGQQFTYSPK